jgi:hypothetical protein
MKRTKDEEEQDRRKSERAFFKKPKRESPNGSFSVFAKEKKRQTLLNQRLFYGATILSLIIIF